MQSTATKIILLGGGYVSVWAYRSLAKQLRTQLRNGQVEITVICPNTHHAFHGWTAETLTGILQEQNQVSPLADIMPYAQHIQGQAIAVDLKTKTVKVKMTAGLVEKQLPYDHLLLGIGSFDSENIDGISQYGYQIKAHQAFQRTKEAIPALVWQAAQAASEAQELLTFTVAGGGFTGVEIACNLVEYVTILKNMYPSLHQIQPRVRLVHRGERVLPVLQADYNYLVKYAEKIMSQYGIDVINNTGLTRLTSEGAFLSNGSFLPSSMVISTVGQSRFQLPGTERMTRDSVERIYTNRYQQIPGYTDVWGGGDACNVTHHQTGEACPANALWAIKHGEYVGRNIARAIQGKALKPFTYRGLGQSASLGMGKGITELYGLQFTGVIAWLMRWFFFNYFMPSRRVMLRGIGDWLSLTFTRRRKGLITTSGEQESASNSVSYVIASSR
ncbi:FAD-dependent oxidoreductase [Spirosoma sp. BT702]|uniref:NADH:ubiquinone reductase (non-electrogenic) n=1 Tax=Spirosoma profusum TaxID=2771354 RepID=A0A927AVB0_9BACT|nr:FAD-dependent oxidoreductase [Spirosoma profusum]MBD2705056.1 FAD-dependent oxidoreductase [Spirosoma profusum]